MNDVNFNTVDLSKVSNENLQKLAAAIAAEQNERKASRFKELAEAAAGALNALAKEFPFVEFNIDIECGECDFCDVINLFDCTSKFSASDFRM